MKEERINKYIQNLANENEIEQLFNEVETDNKTFKNLVHAKRIIALDTIDSSNKYRAWQNIQQRTYKKKGKQYQIKTILLQAAALILALGVGFLANSIVSDESEKQLYSNYATITAPLGQMSTINLPDGTTVLLNSGSTLAYGSSYSHGERDVVLNGEAYFKVLTDSLHPFVVNTERLNYKVFGTSFNICSYPEDEHTDAVLIEGSIGVFDKRGKELRRLKPGEKASFNHVENKMYYSTVETEFYTSWQEGMIAFKNETLEEIAQKLERWYNVKIIIRNPKLRKQEYRGTILKNKPIDQLHKVLQLTSNIKYTIQTRTKEQTLIFWD